MYVTKATLSLRYRNIVILPENIVLTKLQALGMEIPGNVTHYRHLLFSPFNVIMEEPIWLEGLP